MAERMQLASEQLRQLVILQRLNVIISAAVMSKIARELQTEHERTEGSACAHLTAWSRLIKPSPGTSTGGSGGDGNASPMRGSRGVRRPGSAATARRARSRANRSNATASSRTSSGRSCRASGDSRYARISCDSAAGSSAHSARCIG